jgi:hypothetical protein
MTQEASEARHVIRLILPVFFSLEKFFDQFFSLSLWEIIENVNSGLHNLAVFQNCPYLVLLYLGDEIFTPQ